MSKLSVLLHRLFDRPEESVLDIAKRYLGDALEEVIEIIQRAVTVVDMAQPQNPYLHGYADTNTLNREFVVNVARSAVQSLGTKTNVPTWLLSLLVEYILAHLRIAQEAGEVPTTPTVATGDTGLKSREPFTTADWHRQPLNVGASSTKDLNNV